jgi:hypothetical protein
MEQIDYIQNHKAVAYAVTHKDEMPDNIKKFIDDLYDYEESGKRLQGVRNQSIESLKKIDEEMAKLYGSIDAVIKIIARELGPEKVTELGNKYQPSVETTQTPEKTE